jgi:hypothetical protein
MEICIFVCVCMCACVRVWLRVNIKHFSAGFSMGPATRFDYAQFFSWHVKSLPFLAVLMLRI